MAINSICHGIPTPTRKMKYNVFNQALLSSLNFSHSNGRHSVRYEKSAIIITIYAMAAILLFQAFPL